MLTVALIFGGRSAEHEVSLVSARCLAAALDPDRYQVVPVGITHDGHWLVPDDFASAVRDGLETAPGRPVCLLPDPTRPGLLVGDGERVIPVDVAFPVVHGPYGEDGTIQGLFELADLPYVGAGVAASAVGMDKEFMKAAFAQAGLPQVDYLVSRDRADDVDGLVAEVEADFDYPLFVKPVNLGSSVGIGKAHDGDELATMLDLAFAYDRKIIVEAFADGREIECGVIGNDAARGLGGRARSCRATSSTTTSPNTRRGRWPSSPRRPSEGPRRPRCGGSPRRPSAPSTAPATRAAISSSRRPPAGSW